MAFSSPVFVDTTNCTKFAFMERLSVYVISVVCLLYFRGSLFIVALWSPAGNGLTSWLSFVVSNCEFVTFQLVSWVRYGALLYRFLIFALFLTLIRGEDYLRFCLTGTRMVINI